MPRKARYDRNKQKKAMEAIKSNPPKNVRRAKTPEEAEKKTVKALARVYTEEALEHLAKIMRKSKFPGLQLQAIEQILNRGWGKAVQPVAGGEGEAPIQIDLQEIRRVIVEPPNFDDEDEPEEKPVKHIGEGRADMKTIKDRVRKINSGKS